MHIPIASIEHILTLTAPRPGFKERLAASELQRGLWQLGYRRPVATGELPYSEEPGGLKFLLIAGRSESENYEISSDGSLTVTLRGAGEQALLYAVFDFLERQGAYFGIDGEYYPVTAPDQLTVPDANHPWLGSPGFSTRGLLPWPDFLNCITVYNREDFRAYLEAMLRMRFNTLGIHVYAQSRYWVEPFLSTEYGGVGHAAYADTTASDRWGYLPQRTSRYGMSAAQYFDGEVFGSDATRMARSPWEAAEMSQVLWRDAFDYAERLGIRTGVGFEIYQLPEEIVRACPPEVRTAIKRTIAMPDGGEFDLSFMRVDPTSRNARYILESRLAQLLDAYPSVDYVYLWEDEFTNWESQKTSVETPVEPFRQAHDFLRRHAPGKRLVIGGWGGVARNFERFHRLLPEDIIFTALSDQLGWDPVHEAFGKLGDRERWPIPWIEDDPSMWFPQLHVHRFARDIQLAEDYGCQGMLGIHWRHRIVDPVAGYLARRIWDDQLQPADHYRAYGRTHASGENTEAFAQWLDDVDTNRRFLSTWTGKIRDDGHYEHQELSGDYSEAFTIERDFTISENVIMQQAEAIAALGQLLEGTASPVEQERLGYWYGQSRFMDPYARAWQVGQKLQRLISAQYARKQAGDADAAARAIREQGIPLWIELLKYVREAVLAFQHTAATRNDLGMLASIHNKFVRIATFRTRMALLEFLDELPREAEEAVAAALKSDASLDGAVIVPTRPTRLAVGECVRMTAITPGIREVTTVTLKWRAVGATSWRAIPMQCAGRRTYVTDFEMPGVDGIGVEYTVAATFAGTPSPLVVTAPVEGAYLVTR